MRNQFGFRFKGNKSFTAFVETYFDSNREEISANADVAFGFAQIMGRGFGKINPNVISAILD
jgi:hypothetical protein